MSETRTLSFYGTSDDLFEVIGGTRTEPDEIGCYDSHVILRLMCESDGSGLYIYGRYAPSNIAGCWVVGIMPLEDATLPDWPTKYSTAENGYSPLLTITVPKAAEVVQIFPELGDE